MGGLALALSWVLDFVGCTRIVSAQLELAELGRIGTWLGLAERDLATDRVGIGRAGLDGARLGQARLLYVAKG